MRVVLVIVAAFSALAYGEETGCNEFRDKKLEYLDRHNVRCPDGKALSNWTFRPCDNNNQKAVYGCSDIPGALGGLTERYTGCNEIRDKELEYLDRQNVKCEAGEVMQGFQLVQGSCGGNHMQFKIYCRSYSGLLNSPSTGHTGCNEVDRKRIEYLDRHTPSCGSGFMTKWQMTRSGCSGINQRIEFNCVALSEPPVNCVGAYSTCDASCQKYYFVTTAAAHGGSECPAAAGDAAECAPGEDDCPFPPENCVGGYSTCDASCQKYYFVTTAAAHGGAECPASAGDAASCAPGEDDCPAKVDTPAPVTPAAEQPAPIDTLDKLKAWCAESSSNCKTCKGKMKGGVCKIKDKKIQKCSIFKKGDVCDRIVGCNLKSKNGKQKCAGGKHGLK